MGFAFVHFFSRGIDPFESDYKDPDNGKPMDSAKFEGQLLQTCFECHSAPGIFSVNSYTGFLSFHDQMHPTDLTPLDPAYNGRDAIDWKQSQYSWGLLQGLWLVGDDVRSL